MMYHTLTSDTIFSKIRVSHLLLLNGINWTRELDSKVKSFTDFKKNILSFIRPKANSVFNCNSPKKLKFVTRLRLGLSHLDSINSLCSCSLDVESTIHFTISFTALNSQSKNPLS